MSESRPDQNLPRTTMSGSAEPSMPRALTAEERASMARSSAGTSASPSLTPADVSAGVAPAATAAGTVWQSNTRVTALWCINQDRNVYMYTRNASTNTDIGWNKLSTASESGVVALN